LLSPGYSSQNAIFNFVLNGTGTYYFGKQGTDEQRQINLVDNFSAVEHGHQLKFGVDYRWLFAFSSPYAYNQLVQFLGVQCSNPPCPGYAESGTSAVANIFAYQSDTLISKHLSFYGQDTWRITPQLTATYGLR
jgi:outer membrane receptor protein involved in Fe transport